MILSYCHLFYIVESRGSDIAVALVPNSDFDHDPRYGPGDWRQFGSLIAVSNGTFYINLKQLAIFTLLMVGGFRQHLCAVASQGQILTGFVNVCDRSTLSIIPLLRSFIHHETNVHGPVHILNDALFLDDHLEEVELQEITPLSVRPQRLAAKEANIRLKALKDSGDL